VFWKCGSEERKEEKKGEGSRIYVALAF